MKKTLASLAVAGLLLTGCTQATTETPPPAPAETAIAQTEPDVEEGTPSQKAAYEEAVEELEKVDFSKAGLIKHMEEEKVTTEDATWAVDHLGCQVDWLLQAEKRAAAIKAKGEISKDALVAALLEDGFTPEEAEHGATQNNL